MSVNQQSMKFSTQVKLDQALNNAISKMINLNDDILSLRYRPCYTQRPYLHFNRCGLLDFKLNSKGNFYFQSVAKYLSWKPDWPIIKEDIGIRNYFLEAMNKFREHNAGDQTPNPDTNDRPSDLRNGHGLEMDSISSQSFNRQIPKRSINFNKRLEALKNNVSKENDKDGEKNLKADENMLKNVSTYSQLTISSEISKVNQNDSTITSHDSKSLNKKNVPLLNFNKRLEEMKNKLSNQSRNTDLGNLTGDEKNKNVLDQNIWSHVSKSSATKYRKGVSDTGTAYYTMNTSYYSYTSKGKKVPNMPILAKEESKTKLLANLGMMFDNESANKNNDKFLSLNKHLHMETDRDNSKPSISKFRKLVSDGGSVYFTAENSVLSPILSPIRKSDLMKAMNIINGDEKNDKTKLSKNYAMPPSGSQPITERNEKSFNIKNDLYVEKNRVNSQVSISKFQKLASDTRSAYFTAHSSIGSETYTPNKRLEMVTEGNVPSMNKGKRVLSDYELKLNENQSTNRMNYTLFNLNKDFQNEIHKGNSKSSMSKFRSIISDHGTLYFTAESSYFSDLTSSKQSDSKMRSYLNSYKRSQTRSSTNSKSQLSQSMDVKKEFSFNINKDIQREISKGTSKLSISNYRKVVSDAGTAYYSMESPGDFQTMPPSKIQPPGKKS